MISTDEYTYLLIKSNIKAGCKDQAVRYLQYYTQRYGPLSKEWGDKIKELLGGEEDAK